MSNPAPKHDKADEKQDDAKNDDNKQNEANKMRKRKPRMKDTFGQRGWIVKQFFKADVNKDRMLDKKECSKVIDGLGLTDYNDAIFAMLDANVDGTISKNEFVNGMETVMKMKESGIEWLNYVFSIFEKYDVNVKDGKITQKEFIEAYGGNDAQSQKEANQVWKEITKFDANNDGVISFNEFVKFYASIKIEFAEKMKG